MVEGSTEILADINKEAGRIAEALEKSDVPLRLMGGAAVYLRCPSCTHERLRRVYADLDFVGLGNRWLEIKRFIIDLGYEPDDWFNKLHGRTRMLFWDKANNRQIDVFLDQMKMCHVIDFRSRLLIDPHTLTIADLLLTKLQIIQLNPKDLIDTFAILFDHKIEARDGNWINGRYLARLASRDWGLYRTIQQNLEYIRRAASDMPDIGPFRPEEQVEALWQMIQDEPKSLKWKLRAAFGDRFKWYEVPEEVGRN